MNRQYAIAWSAWLRDPSNKQTMGCLRDPNGFCCLGGLCEVWNSQESVITPLQWVPDSRTDGGKLKDLFSFFNAKSVLPMEVMHEVGMHSVSGEFKFPGHLHPRKNQTISLTGCNDSGEFTFPMIADIVDYFWKEL